MIDNFSNDIYSANIYFFGFIPQINGKFLPSIRGLNHRRKLYLQPRTPALT